MWPTNDTSGRSENRPRCPLNVICMVVGANSDAAFRVLFAHFLLLALASMTRLRSCLAPPQVQGGPPSIASYSVPVGTYPGSRHKRVHAAAVARGQQGGYASIDVVSSASAGMQQQ